MISVSRSRYTTCFGSLQRLRLENIWMKEKQMSSMVLFLFDKMRKLSLRSGSRELLNIATIFLVAPAPCRHTPLQIYDTRSAQTHLQWNATGGGSREGVGAVAFEKQGNKALEVQTIFCDEFSSKFWALGVRVADTCEPDLENVLSLRIIHPSEGIVQFVVLCHILWLHALRCIWCPDDTDLSLWQAHHHQNWIQTTPCKAACILFIPDTRGMKDAWGRHVPIALRWSKDAKVCWTPDRWRIDKIGHDGQDNMFVGQMSARALPECIVDANRVLEVTHLHSRTHHIGR